MNFTLLFYSNLTRNRYKLSTNRFENVDIYEGVDLIRLGFEDELKRIMVFEKECPSYKHIMVYDIKTTGFEESEDYLYSAHSDLQYNLRKGHTIVEIYDPENFDIK